MPLPAAVGPAVNVPELLAWQWEGYARYHQNRANLLLHIFVVPVFLVGTVLIVIGGVTLSVDSLVAGVFCVVASVVLQGRGHKLEPVPPEPFTGPANFIGRLFLEQWVTFPRFVLSGGWSQNLARSRSAV